MTVLPCRHAYCYPCSFLYCSKYVQNLMKKMMVLCIFICGSDYWSLKPADNQINLLHILFTVVLQLGICYMSGICTNIKLTSTKET